MMPETSQASMMQNEAKMRQSTPPTWNGPFAHGGLADGGQPAPVVTGAPTHGPDVVSPTADYLKGLGEAQEAQQRANDVQEKQHAVQQANPFMYSPDLSPFGQMMNARGLMQASQAQGQEGMYSPSYNGKPLGFVRGGLAGGGEGGGDVPYQDTGGLDIPDDKSWQQDKSEQKSMEPAPQKSGDSGGGGGAMGALGSIAGVIGKIAPLFMLAKGGGVQDGDEIPMGAVQREDDDDLPLLEREGGLLPKENAPLPPERPAGLGHALPDHFAEPDRFAPAGEHSRSMAPEGFTPNGPDNPLPEPFDRAKRFTLEDTHSRDMAPEGFTPNKPDNPLPEPFAAGLAGDRTAMADALRGDNSVAAMAPDNFTPGRPPSPLDRSELEGSPFAGYEKGLGADPLKADLQQNPPRVMPGLDPRVANRALNQEDIGGNPDQPGAKLPNRVPTPMPPGPVRADVNEPPRPLPPPDAGLVKKAAPAPVTPPVRPAAAGLNPSAPLQPHIVHTVPVAPQPARQIPGAMQPSYGANAYAPTPRIAPAQQAIEQGIPGARGRNVSPSSPATIHDYGGWQAPSVGQVFNRAAEIARQYGIDPHLFQRMIQQESGGLIDNIGDGRSSFGVIQAHFGGINPKMPHAGMGDDMRRAGIDVFDPSTWEKQLAFAANHIRNSGWSAWTTTMRKLGYNYASGGLVPPRRDEEA